MMQLVTMSTHILIGKFISLKHHSILISHLDIVGTLLSIYFPVISSLSPPILDPLEFVDVEGPTIAKIGFARAAFDRRELPTTIG